MTQNEMDKMAEALRDQGLTWGQTMFAVSVVLEAIHTEREACAKVAEQVGQHKNQHGIASAIRARGQA